MRGMQKNYIKKSAEGTMTRPGASGFIDKQKLLMKGILVRRSFLEIYHPQISKDR